MTDPLKDERPAAPIDPQTPRQESTPIGDELAMETANDEDDDDDPELTEVPFVAKSIKKDVERALARTTDDGKGDDEVPPSNWRGYATNDVEVED